MPMQRLMEAEHIREKKEEESEPKNDRYTLSPGRSILVQRLLNKEDKLAKLYSRSTLKKFPDLKEEITSHPGGIEHFSLEIERWLEQICDALRANNLSFLDSSDPQLYLLLNSAYKYADIKVYNELFNVIKKDLSRNLSENVKNDLFECINYLEREVLRFV